MIPDAEFSEPDRKRRFWLTRDWSDELPAPLKTVNFIMLNPSIADEKKPDPTIRRCIGQTRKWGGFSRIVATNLIPIVEPKPELLPAWSGIDPENRDHLKRWMAEAHLVVVAWGGSLTKEIALKIGFARHITALRAIATVELYCIGHTQTGELHPSRPAYTTEPIRWEPNN
jgi:hypothetical protein